MVLFQEPFGANKDSVAVGYGWLVDWLVGCLQWVRAHMVPLHLGLIDSPFVPHNLLLRISSGEPCTFTKVPDGLQT
jgi:hypothetical protein